MIRGLLLCPRNKGSDEQNYVNGYLHLFFFFLNENRTDSHGVASGR